MKIQTRLLASTSMAAWLCLSGYAHAADAAATDAKDTVDELVVRGLGADRGQNRTTDNGALGDKPLLDTPFSVTVVDAQDISRRQVTTVGQIFFADPSVSSFATAGTTNWWGTQIRGLGVRNYYVDGVPLLLYWGGDYPLESVESVEAMKGLSGFMYGFGAPGGVISYKTKRPTTAPLFTTELGYRNSSVFFGHLDAGGPVDAEDRLGYRVNLAMEKGEAYNSASVDRKLASGALEYAISPNLKWYGTLTYEDSNLKHEPFQIYWSAYQGARLPKPTYDYDNLNVGNSFYKTRTLTGATGLGWQISDDWKADFTYGYTRKQHQSNKMFVNILNEAGDYNGFAYNFAETDVNHFFQAMAQGKFTTGPIRHDVVLGISYQKVSQDFGLNDYHWGNDFNGNIYQPQPFRVTRDIGFSTDGSPYEERQEAVFASDTLYLGDKWQAVLGARATRYRILDVDRDPTVDSRYQASAVTPTVALIYKPASYVSIYGSYVESLEGGGRVGAEYANVGDILGATVSKQYEVGVKYEHERASFTAAAFRIERVNQIDQLRDGLKYLTQDGLTRYDGAEAIGSYRVTDNWKVGLGAVYLDAKISEVSPENAALLGNTPGEAAKWQVVANTEYAVPFIEGLTLHGAARYYDKAPTDDGNNLYIPSRTLVNVGFQYRTTIADQDLVFTGNINNVFNEKYWGQSNIGEAINGSLSVKAYW